MSLRHHVVAPSDKPEWRRAAAKIVGVTCWLVLHVVLGAGFTAAAAQREPAEAESTMERALEDPVANAGTNPRVAQFALPKRATGGKAPVRRIPKALQFQYIYGAELEVPYTRDADLDRGLSDNSLIATPTVFGAITYRPTDWLETTAELKFERPIGLREEEVLIIPGGEQQSIDRKRFNLFLPQALVKVKPPSIPVEFTLGRRNFEDARLWLYDSELDAAIIAVKPGDFHIEASVSRSNYKDLDLLVNLPAGQITNDIVYVEYRGIEDNKLAGYYISRRDANDEEGRRLFFGARAHGTPSDRFNYWAELSFLRGDDELERDFEGRALDVGGTYRFLNLPLQPNITLAYAWGSGDDNTGEGKNSEFRQTGLQSNESKFGGVTQFKSYGEALDPELSNLRIMTAALGFRPAAGIFVDLVYHRYRLNALAESIRNWGLTAKMNQLADRPEKDVGSEFDVIIGFRNMFGLRGFGLDLRAGWFFPGDAFLRDDGGTTREADKGLRVVGKFFY